MGLGLIGVINKESCQYPIKIMQRKYFTNRSNFYGFVSVDEGLHEMMAFEWVDYDRPYFSVTRVPLDKVKAVLRQIWRQFIK